MKILIDNDIVLASADEIVFGFYENENKYRIGAEGNCYYVGIPEDRCLVENITSLPDDFAIGKYKYLNKKLVLNENWEEPKLVEDK